MDNKLTMLKYVEYCTDKREEAYKEYAKYNGFTSQTSETMTDNTLLRFYKGFFLEETINGTKVHLYKEDNFVLIRECENTEEAKERIDTQTI